MRNAYVKYGPESFTRGLLELVDDPADLLTREQLWIDSGAATFNINKRAGKPPGRIGYKQSPETIAKISAALTGRKYSPERVAQISATVRGRKMPLESRAKISAALTGRKKRPGQGRRTSEKVSKRYSFVGEMLTLTQISERTGIKRSTLKARVQSNVPLEAPLRNHKSYADFGEQLTLTEISKRAGIHIATLHWRAKKGNPLV